MNIKKGHHFHHNAFRYNFFSGYSDTEVKIEDAYFLGKTLGTIALKSTSHQKPHRPVACISHDGRLNATTMEQEFARGLITTGVHLLRMGVIPTPATMLCAHDLDLDFAIIITSESSDASKIGFKILYKNYPLTQEHKAHILSLSATKNWHLQEGGKSLKTDILQAYCSYLTNLHSIKKGCNVVWDAAHSIAGAVLSTLTHALPGTHHIINGDIESSFHHQRPDPFDPKGLIHLEKTVIAKNADLGFRFNADGSALTMVNAKGQKIAEENIFLWIAQDMLKENPEALFGVDFFTHPGILKKLAVKPQQIIFQHGDWESFHAQKGRKTALNYSCEGRFFVKNTFRDIEDSFAIALHIIALHERTPLTESSNFLPQPVKHIPTTNAITVYENFLGKKQPENSSLNKRFFIWNEDDHRMTMRLDAPGNALWLRAFGKQAQQKQQQIIEELTSLEQHVY